MLFSHTLCTKKAVLDVVRDNCGHGVGKSFFPAMTLNKGLYTTRKQTGTKRYMKLIYEGFDVYTYELIN